MIDDDDCEVGEPTPVDDEFIRPSGITFPTQGTAFVSALIPVIPVVRMIAQLKKTLKSPRTITENTLSTYDGHFRTILNTYPDPFNTTSQAYLDPRYLLAVCSLQTARFFLYRHNLSPVCRTSDRRDALDRCVHVAIDTAHYVQRSMQQGSHSPNSGFYTPQHMSQWAARLRTMAPAFFCSHLWRCTLILCLRLEFAHALTLVQASASIGDLRKNNIACGRNLAFFLDQLISRLRSGYQPQNLDTDEEMLAYASGDLQASGDEAWVWTGSETGANLNNKVQAQTSPMDGATELRSDIYSSVLGEHEQRDWGGWDHIQRTLKGLLQEKQNSMPPPPPSMPQQQQQQQSHQQPQQHSPISLPPPQRSPTYPPPPPAAVAAAGVYPPAPTQHLAPHSAGSSHHSSMSSSASGSISGSTSGTTSNRISIQDIM
jgi:hypothetical protein